MALFEGLVARGMRHPLAMLLRAAIPFNTFEDFGATGGTDDTVAMAAALAEGGIIVGKPGRTYTFNTSLTFAAGTTVIGAKLKLKDSATYTTGALLNLNAGNCRLIDCDVDGNNGNNANNANALGIYIGDGNDCEVSGCYIHDMTGYGVFVDDGLRPRITGNRFVDTFILAIGVFPDVGSAAATKAQITGNTISEPRQHAIYIQDSDYNVIRGNTVEGTLNANMVVDVSGTAVTWVSGTTFANVRAGEFLFVNGGTELYIASVESATALTLNSTGGSLNDVPAAAGTGDLVVVMSGVGNIIAENVIIKGVSLAVSGGNGFNSSTGKSSGLLITGNICIGQGCCGISLQSTGSPGTAGTSIIGNTVLNAGKTGTAAATAARVAILVLGTNITDTFIDSNLVYDDGATAPATTYWLHSSASAGEVRVGNNDTWGMANSGVSGTAVAAVAEPLNATGVVFPATQVPSSNANTLDDYEEGTFTPVFAFSTPGDSSFTYATALGSYTKIGRVVQILVVLNFTTNAYTTAAGNATISGLPFTPAFASPLAMGYTDKVTIPANTLQLGPMTTTSSTILIWTVKDNGTASSPLTTAAFPASTANAILYISGMYYV
jgi:parallel beta-helix repeat protein